MELSKKNRIIILIISLTLIIFLWLIKYLSLEGVGVLTIFSLVTYQILFDYRKVDEKIKYNDVRVTDADGEFKLFFPNNVVFTKKQEYTKKVFSLKTPQQTFFTKETSSNNFDIYKDVELKEYAISLILSKTFPLLNKNKPDEVIWSSSYYNARAGQKYSYLTWRKEGKEIIHLKRTNSIFEKKFGFSGQIENNELDLLAALICLFYANDVRGGD